MAFCNNCGLSLSNGARFCKACGTPVNQEQENEAQQGELEIPANTGTASEALPDPSTQKAAEMEPKPDHPAASLQLSANEGTRAQVAPTGTTSVHAKTPPTRKKSRRNVILAATAFLIAVLLFGGYRFGVYWTSDERLIAQFEKALERKDGKAVAGLLDADEDGLKIDQETVAGYMKYAAASPNTVKYVVNSLKRQASLLSKGQTPVHHGEPVNLEKSGKFLFLFDQYRLVVSPVYLSIETNYKDVALSVNGKEIAKTDKPGYSHKFGPYLPGVYELKASLKNDWIKLEQEAEAEVIEPGETYSISLELDGEEVTLDTSLDDGTALEARLFLNGKNVGVNPFEKATYGPVTLDGSLKLSVEADFPWGTMKTGEIPVRENEVELELANDSSFKAKIMDIVTKYNREELEAFSSDNVSLITQRTDAARSAVQEDVDYSKAQNIGYKTTYLGTDFDTDSFRLFREDGKWRLALLSIATYQQGVLTSGTSGAAEEQAQGRSVSLVFDEGAKAWLVDDVETFYDGVDMSDHMEARKEKDPKTFTTSWSAAGSGPQLDMTSAQAFMSTYLSKSVEAINTRDFNVVANLMDPSGPAYAESENYIGHLEEKGITEELVSVKVGNVKPIDGQTYEIATNETYNITYKDGSVKSKSFASVYKVVVLNEEFRIHKLISTTEIQ